ncbi:putative PAS/PAC sensor protein [Kineococcus radiotolerans SRS30216 = ATCC BAA-149]|uniref:PAS/PAC sensor protein n=1 Tax=Kineococcus radiotolerans (strain ATCC BAA-149 / DSM 14245 / SRS30216) TaxID=266940 RepID=A6W6J6_KINRD|nr:putative PAS/PAC sensor protein [Kineococcus radiotolerans SRS30216 = ATCC BAA-149]
MLLLGSSGWAVRRPGFVPGRASRARASPAPRGSATRGGRRAEDGPGPGPSGWVRLPVRTASPTRRSPDAPVPPTQDLRRDPLRTDAAARVTLDGFAADVDRGASTRRLLSSAPVVALDRLTVLAARSLDAPTAHLSLLGEERHVVAATGPGADPRGHAGPLAGSLCAATAVEGLPLVVPDCAADERVAALPAVRSGAAGAHLGVPLRGRDGHVVGVLSVSSPRPRAWDGADVSTLTTLAAAAVSELELSALAVEHRTARVRGQLAVAAGGVGTFDWDLLTGELVWDERLLDLFGYAADDFGRDIAAFEARLHPDDRSRVGEALQQAIETCGPFEAEYRIVRPDGSTRWVQARGQALPDASGLAVRLLGAAYDTTSARDDDVRVARILESMASAFFFLDRGWRFTYVNAEAEKVLGRRREELLGGNVWALFPDAVGSDFETHYRSVARDGRPATFEAYYPAPLDAWFEVHAWPDPDGVSVYFTDVTERRRTLLELESARAQAVAAHAATTAAAARLQLLATVGEDLSATLDVHEAVARLSQHLVPALADWCLVTLVDEHGGLRDVGCQHSDPALLDTVRAYRDARLSALAPDSYLHGVWRTARPVTIGAGATEAVVRHLAGDSPARDLLRRLAPEALECLPLRAHGRTVGLLTLFHGAEHGPLAPADLLLVTEVADRAGLALDNARLYSAQHRIAESLQRSLLTAPVEPDRVQVAVRYQPAAQAARVGGDWYDAFLTPDGSTVLVIGDVAGHDIEAAAQMSQVRSLLRGIAYATGAGPATVLSGLDAAVSGLAVATTATVVVARLEQDADERRRGVTRLRWANAGHPPPVLVGADGTVRPLAVLPPQLLLGIDPGTHRADAVVALEPGSTVLMFTDGLVERRDRGLEEGLEELQECVAGLAGLTLDELVDGVLARLVPPGHDDDVALVAFRLHPVDEPRPAEAGPAREPDAVLPVPR